MMEAGAQIVLEGTNSKLDGGGKAAALAFPTWVEVACEEPRIRSWTRSCPDNPSNGSDGHMVHFSINDVHIVGDGRGKRHVTYTVTVSRLPAPDPLPCMIDRRYSHFHMLYESLRSLYPSQVACFSFPRKVILGNYGMDVMSHRSRRFQDFLYFICSHDQLMNTPAFSDFLDGDDLNQSCSSMASRRYTEAIGPLQRSFHMLNKVLSDRHPRVLRPLCALVACCVETRKTALAAKYAEIALHRFDAVSDVDLLPMYLPLLKVCAQLWDETGKDRAKVNHLIGRCKSRGMRVESALPLLDVVKKVFC